MRSKINTSGEGGFDYVIPSTIPLGELPVHNLAELIFTRLPRRSEQAEVILSHDANQFLRVSLIDFRAMVARLYQDFSQKGFKPGETILLATVPGNNECLVAILFSALASYGVRVFLPMFTESGELDNWLESTNTQAVIFPATEILALRHHEKEKTLIRKIRQCAEQHGLPLYDSITDFNLRALVHSPKSHRDFGSDPQVAEIIERTNEHSEALIITTSGSSGVSKLVVHEQGAFLRSCLSWQSAGFFDKNLFGGRGFTPLFTHTMGIRSFFNALWCGEPICLLNTEWFAEKPEIIRYFLKQMKPEHVTGGPAAFKLLLEMMRTFPDMKTELKAHLHTIVSSGAPVQADVISELESLLNVPVHNAYGTTETQQVLNTLLIPNPKPEDRFSLGAPLPGVSVGLKRYSKNNIFKLYIHSPFGCKRIIGEKGSHENISSFFDTGDLVRFENGRLFYVGRESQDFLKDGFGVKVPLSQVRSFYDEIFKTHAHVELYPLQHEPGLGALLFPQKPEARDFDSQRKYREHMRLVFEKINDRLYRQLDPFVYRHHTIRRFAVVYGPLPLTPKGSVAHQQIRSNYSEIITQLTGVFPAKKNVEIIRTREDTQDPFSSYANPYLGMMLQELKMDYTYHRGKKDALFTYDAAGKEMEILDMTGGYGTNLLGHNNSALKEAVMDFLASDRVSLANQGSIQSITGQLAEKLNALVGQYSGKSFRVCFASSGAEIVEMALHHACLEWRRRVEKFQDRQNQLFGGYANRLLRRVSAWNQQQLQTCKLHVVVSATGFHGHTSAARSLLKKSEKREAFSNLLPLIPIYVDDQNPNWQVDFEAARAHAFVTLKQVVNKNGRFYIQSRKFSTIIAAIFEPIRGEGGIRRVNPEVLHYFSNQEFPLIVDEIQCGLGRSGSFLASEGVKAHYYLFGKALGGGIEKIAALLIDASRYQNEFGKYYSSTFANGELAAYTALKTLEYIQKHDIPRMAKERGEKIRKYLEKIRQQYPDVITEITGQGLMQGIRFADFSAGDNIILRMVSQNKMLGYLFSSYLLHHHRVRIFPSLSASNVLRIEPSVYISDEEIRHFSRAIEDLAQTVHDRRMYRLCRHLMDNDEFTDNKGKVPIYGYFDTQMEPPAPGSVPVTFIGHFAYPVDELRALEKDFRQASDTGLRILSTKIQRIMEMKPVIIFQKNIFRNRVHFTCMILPLDSAEFERLHREGKRRKIVAKIQKAVDLAVTNGSRIISLGGYISILTHNGMALTVPDSVQIITGNTLTAASGLKRIFNAIQKYRFCQKKCIAGIVGIPGNIGSIIAELLLQRADLFSEIILVGRTKKSLQNFYQYLKDEVKIPSGISVRLETDLTSLANCDVILITTNTNDPIIFKHHLSRRKKVLIADNSVPAAVAEEVLSMPNVMNLPFASYVRMPDDPDFLISTYTPRGTAFCCAAEGILCALKPVPFPLRGKITAEAVQFIAQLAEKYGLFDEMGDIKSFKFGVVS